MEAPQPDLSTLRLRDADLERRFWASWSVPMLVGDVFDAISATAWGTLILLHRLGSVRWDFVRGSICWWMVLGVVLSRIATIAMVLTARKSYLQLRFVLHASLKIYLIYLKPRLFGAGVPQMGPHTWAVLGGKDGKVETSAGIVRALMLPTGAYFSMNHMVLPPFRLPWRLPDGAAAPATRRRHDRGDPPARGAPAWPLPAAHPGRASHLQPGAQRHVPPLGVPARPQPPGRLRRAHGAQLDGPVCLAHPQPRGAFALCVRMCVG
jgi:hypothetical protein